MLVRGSAVVLFKKDVVFIVESIVALLILKLLLLIKKILEDT